MLIAAQIGLSLVLLVGSGLLLRSFLKLVETDPGFRPEHILTVWVPSADKTAEDTAPLILRYGEIIRRTERLPGVAAVGLATTIPMGPFDITTAFCRPGDTAAHEVHFRAVSSRYFRAMGIPLLHGRVFTDADVAGSPRVAVINQALARRFWPGQDPLGQRFSSCEGGRAADTMVVGVTGDTRSFDLAAAPEPELYEPYQQRLEPVASITLVVRAWGDPAGLARSLRQSIHQLYPDQVIASTTAMRALVSGSLAQPRLYAGMASAFAILAIVLTLVGIYGVVAYAVEQRRREIGIRVALGDQWRDVLRTVSGQGVRAILCGAGAGLAASWALSSFLRSMVFGISVYDPLTFAVAPAALALAALAACWLPARKAMGVDPDIALRDD